MLPFLETLLCLTFATTQVADDLRLKPLPAELQPGASALDYHSISVEGSDEPLVDLRKDGIAGEPYYARTDGLNAPYYRAVCSFGEMLSRATVAEKLKRVNAKLKPYGVELYVYDAYRPIECQRALWQYFLKQAHGNREVAGRFCSDPSKFDPNNSQTWPTHSTGGAIDLTLRGIKDGQPLFMGTVFDEASPASYTAAFENDESESASIVDARRNRRLLYWAMHSQGFANYPYEWWHYDYGTQMWVQNSRQLGQAKQKAIYGYINRTRQTSYRAHLRVR